MLEKTKIFISKAQNVHGNFYDYSKVNYTNSKTKVIITCPVHGEFLQTPNSHLNGSGCPKCKGNKISQSKTSTTETFIEKAKKIHGDKYDYSKVEYINNTTPVIIICPKHGEFLQKPNIHLDGSGCKLCFGKNTEKLETKKIKFIEKATLVHNNKYNYNEVEYINTGTKVKIICPIHGEFLQRPADHLKGHGCPKCKSDKAKKSGYTKEEFIALAIEKHGNKYDYSKVEYVNSQTKVCIICPEHGEFWQQPNFHLQGGGCRKCYNDRQNIGTEKFIEKAREVHGEKYNYDKSIYIDTKTPLIITCPIHGDFEQTPNVHLSNKSGCPKCSTSHGEALIIKILDSYKIPYKYQFKLVNDYFKGSTLYIDFFIKYNDFQYFIEYNGIQHYHINEYFGGEKELIRQQNRDALLRDFCKLHSNKVKLLEIPYTMKDNEIENTILKFIEYKPVSSIIGV